MRITGSPSQTPQRLPRLRRGGFTLIELVLALVILAMLTGSVYSIIRTAIVASVDVQKDASEDDQVNQFIRLCRQAFQNLPSTATINLKITDPGPPTAELTISGAPESFSFGANPISYQDTVISTRMDTDATQANTDGATVYSASITRQDIIPQDSTQSAQMIQATLSNDLAPDDQGRTWLPLLRNVASLSWRCYQDDSTQWVTEWDGTNLPQLVEMTLQLVGRANPIRVVFTIPGTTVAGANSNLIPPATASAGGGGGANGGGGAGGRGKGKGKGGEGKGKGGEGKGKTGTNKSSGGKGESKGSNKSESNKGESKGESNKSSSNSKSSGSSSKGGGSSSSSSGGRR